MSALEFFSETVDAKFVGSLKGLEFKSDAVKEAVISFGRSMEEVVAFQQAPAVLVKVSRYLAENWADATHAVTGNHKFRPEIFDDRPTYVKIMEAHARLFEQKNTDEKIIEDVLEPGRGLEFLHMGFMMPEVPFETHFSAIGSGMLIYAWTGFEVFMKDLYTALTRLTPKRMDGTDKIRTQYENIPGLPAPFMDALNSDAVTSIFALRNVVTHNHGIIDELFLRRSEGVNILQRWRNQGAGFKIPFGGNLVATHINLLIRSSVDMIDAIREFTPPAPESTLLA